MLANDFCASAHPSDAAAALLALDATLVTTGRRLGIGELYRVPSEDDRRMTTLEPGELILEIELPPCDGSVYLKAMERKLFGFPLVGVAAALVGGTTRVALAGVAPMPWLLGNDDLDSATPLPQNAYKVEIATALVRRARAELTARDDECTTTPEAPAPRGPAGAVLLLAGVRRRPQGSDLDERSRRREGDGRHRGREDQRGHLLDRARPTGLAAHRRIVRAAGAEGVLQRDDLPPDRAGLRDPGWRPDGTGSGGPGYSTDDAVPAKTTYLHGTVAMAKTETDPPGTAGSQFFVVTAANAGLPPIYAVLGHVTSGLDVVDRIGTFGNAQEQPTKRIVVRSITIR